MSGFDPLARSRFVRYMNETVPINSQGLSLKLLKFIPVSKILPADYALLTYCLSTTLPNSRYITPVIGPLTKGIC